MKYYIQELAPFVIGIAIGAAILACFKANINRIPDPVPLERGGEPYSALATNNDKIVYTTGPSGITVIQNTKPHPLLPVVIPRQNPESNGLPPGYSIEKSSDGLFRYVSDDGWADLFPDETFKEAVSDAIRSYEYRKAKAKRTWETVSP